MIKIMQPYDCLPKHKSHDTKKLSYTIQEFKQLLKAPQIKKGYKKYRNKPTKGYASKKEYERSKELKLLLKKDIIRDLKEQFTFTLQEKFIYKGKTIRAIKYIADSVYYHVEKKLTIVEDVKSAATRKIALYRIKKKLFLLKYGKEYEFIET